MATNVARIQAVLDLDTGRFQGSVRTATGALNTFNRSINQSHSHVSTLGTSLRDTMIVLGQFRAAMHTVWAFTGQWVAAIIDANSQLERLQVLMKGLSKSTTEAGRVADALRDMNYVLEKSKNAPFDIATISDAFVKLKASGIDPAKGSLDSLIDATARFGGNSETLHRASIAIQQMAGKGVISMEELRQQLGEAVPNAMKLMAQATGMSMAQLVKTISTGRLQASGALNKLFLEMRIQFAGSSEKMMNTWSGLIAKLKTEWLLFAKEIGDGGLYDNAKQSLRDLIKFMGSDEGRTLAHQLGQSIAEAARMAANFGHWLIENREELVRWGKLLAEIFILKRVTDFGMSLVKATAGIFSFTRSLGPLRAALIAARSGTASWLEVLGAAAGPIGIAVTAIGGLVLWLHNQAQAAVDAGNAMQDYYDRTARGQAVSRKEQTLAEKRLDYLRRVKDALNQVAEAERTGGQARVDASNTVNGLLKEGRKLGFVQDAKIGLHDQFDSLASQAKHLSQMYVREIHDATVKFVEQASIQSAQEAHKIIGNMASNERKIGEQIMSATAPELNSIQERLDAGLLKPEEAAAKRSEILGGAMKKRIARLHAMKVEFETQLSTTVDPSKLAAAKAGMAEVDQLLAEAFEDRKTIEDPLVLLPKMGGNEGGKGKVDPLKTYIEGLVGRIAQVKASMEDADPTFEKFKAQLFEGKYGKGRSGPLVEEAMALSKALDQVNEDFKKFKATEKLKQDLEDMEAQSGSDAMVAKLQGVGELYDQVASGMVSFNRQIAVMRANLPNTNMTLEEFEKHVATIKANLLDVDIQSFQEYATNNAWDAYLDSLPERTRNLKIFTHELEQNRIAKDQMIKDAAGDADKIAKIEAAALTNEQAIMQRYANATKPAWAKLIDEWQDTTTAMDNMWANTMQSFSNYLVEALTTGQASFRDFATGVLKEITRILVNKAIAQFATLFIEMFGFGGQGSVLAKGGAVEGGEFVSPFAKGGAFQRFASGGAFTNKITSGTNVAPMAMFGEAGPEAIMPLSKDSTGTLGVKMHGDMGGTQVNNQVSINVTVNQDGSGDSNTKANSQNGEQLARILDARVRETMAQEMRPGGILWRMRNGGA